MASETEKNPSYAIVRVDGRSQRVKEGDKIRVQQIDDGQKSEVIFSEVLLVKKSDSDTPTVGAPLVEGASVKGAIIKKDKGKKLIAFKRKRRQGFLKKKGSRPQYYEVEVTGINF